MTHASVRPIMKLGNAVGIASAAALGLVVVAGTGVLARQDEVATRLTQQIDRIMATRTYAVPRFGPARWVPGRAAYTTVEPAASPDTGMDIVRYDATTGTREVLVPARLLTPAGATKGLAIDDYGWSEDGRRLLIFTNTRKVWRDNTRGDYWVVDLDPDDRSAGSTRTEGARLRKLGGDGPEASLLFAKFSPDSTRVAYVRANDLFVERLDDGTHHAADSDGSETTINGTSDWVYEEELGVRDAFRWSPDSRAIAYWQFDSTGVETFTLINSTDSLYPTLTRIPYPKAGTRNSAVRVGVIDANGGATTWMQVPGDPREHYIARLSWIDKDAVAIQQLNRLQNRHDLLRGDARTGATRLIFRDESTTWVDADQDVRWIDRNRAFLWVSERDGWRHVYRVPRDGGDARLVTTFDADILSLVGVDEAAGWLYVTASPGNATQAYLYRARLDGSGAPERVTPDNAPGTHSYVLAPDGRLAFHTASRVDVPPMTDIVDLPAHRSLRTLTDTTALVSALAPLVATPTEFLTVDIGAGVTLDGWMIKPSSFDPARHYPIIVFVYGEPAAQTVVDRWTRRQAPLPPCAGGRGISRRLVRQSRHACAQGRRVAQGDLRRGRGVVGEGAGRCRARVCRHATVCRYHARRRLGLERWRIEHAEHDVPLPRHLPRRRVGGAGAGPAPVRHDLPGALHGHARRATPRATGSGRRSTLPIA